MTSYPHIDGINSIGGNFQGGMVHSVLSNYPTQLPVLWTDFLSLSKIPKATVTDTEFNLVQALNFIANNGNSRTDPKLFNIGINANNQFYIKTESQPSIPTGSAAPSILIDTNGDVYVNNQILPLSSSEGFLFVFDTQGITPYNRKTANLGIVGPNYWTDPTTGAERFDNVFFGSPVSGSYAWNVKYMPPSAPTKQMVYNSSPIPGSSAPGFRAFATVAEPLPVDCVVSGEFFQVAPAPDGALIGLVGHTYSNTPITSNFTASFTLTVGIVKQIWNPTGTPPVTHELIASQDIDVPFRGTSVGTVASFSCNFAFNMTDLDPATNLEISYIPFFNHNSIIYPATDSNIRWRNINVTFTTKRNI